MIPGVPRDELAAKGNVYALGARILGAEIDDTLYRRLSTAGLLDARDDPAGDLDDLAAEYCRLLVASPSRSLPYASVHLRSGVLGIDPEHRLTQFLAEHHLDVVADPATRFLALDHIAVELALLGHLYHRAARVTDRTHTWHALRELLHEHLLPWAPRLLAELAGDARLAPYTIILPTLTDLLAEDQGQAHTVDPADVEALLEE